MRNTLTALAVAATMAVATVAAPSSADARSRGLGVAAGIFGGLVTGALIAGAHRGYYYDAYPVYGPRPYAYYPRCYWHRERVWDGWGWRRQRVRVCD